MHFLTRLPKLNQNVIKNYLLIVQANASDKDFETLNHNFRILKKRNSHLESSFMTLKNHFLHTSLNLLQI